MREIVKCTNERRQGEAQELDHDEVFTTISLGELYAYKALLLFMSIICS